MPHNDYLKPGGVWGLFSIFTSPIAAQMDLYLYQAINGDLGGTWAPSAAVTIGGLGLQVFGPFVATDAQITIMPGKFISVQTGATLVMNPGSTFSMFATMNVGPLGGSILFHGGSVMQFYDLSGIILNTGTSILAGPGAGIGIASGAQFNAVAGSGVLFAGSTTFPSGASLEQQAGALWSLKGTTTIGSVAAGFLTFGALGTLTFVSGSAMTGFLQVSSMTFDMQSCTFRGITNVQGPGIRASIALGSLGDLTVASGGRIVFSPGSEVSGFHTRTSGQKRSGTGAYNDLRDPLTLADANATIDGSQCDLAEMPQITASRDYALSNPSGRVLRLVVTRHIIGTSVHAATVRWSGVTLASYGSGTDTRVTHEYHSDGTDWFLLY